MSNAVIINSNEVSTGTSYDGEYTFSRDFSGYFKMLYYWLDDGNIPICYYGINSVVIYKNSAPTILKTLYFDDLSSDDPTDVAAWFTSSFAALSGLLGVTLSSVLQQADGSYQCIFSAAITFVLSSPSSSASNIFGNSDLTGSTINFANENINARPKFIGVKLGQAAQITSYGLNSNINLYLSTKDDLSLNQIISFESEQNVLDLQIARINAPLVACPLTLDFIIILQAVSSSTSA